jgi:ribonuclease E
MPNSTEAAVPPETQAAVAEQAAPEPVAAEDDAAPRRSRRGRRRKGPDGEFSPLGVPGAEQPDLVPVYDGPTPADPFGGNVFDLFDAMEQAELNAAPASRPAPGRRGQSGRSRWHPPHWALASEPPMLADQQAAGRPEGRSEGRPEGRPERGTQAETWALPSRPFMLRRDRHTPRWGQHRGAPRTAVVREPELLDTPGTQPEAPVVPIARPVPIEAGPPPVAEVAAVEVMVPDQEARPNPEAQMAPVEAEIRAPEISGPELAAVADVTPEPPPVPANDVVAGPVVQPIVIGSESAPPPERKRGWWRRR